GRRGAAAAAAAGPAELPRHGGGENGSHCRQGGGGAGAAGGPAGRGPAGTGRGPEEGMVSDPTVAPDDQAARASLAAGGAATRRRIDRLTQPAASASSRQNRRTRLRHAAERLAETLTEFLDGPDDQAQEGAPPRRRGG